MSLLIKKIMIMAGMIGATTIGTTEELQQEDQRAAVVVYELTQDDLEEEAYFDSLELLAMVVEAEAGNQDLYGKRLVVDVVLNRVDDPTWPDTIYEVLCQDDQFTTMWDGSVERLLEPSEDSFLAVRMELESRTNSEIVYFTAEGYGEYGTHAFQYKDHYFCTK